MGNCEAFNPKLWKKNQLHIESSHKLLNFRTTENCEGETSAAAEHHLEPSAMISFLGKSGSSGVSHSLSAVRQTVPSILRPLALGVEVPVEPVHDLKQETHTSYRASKRLPEAGVLGSRGTRASRSITGRP